MSGMSTPARLSLAAALATVLSSLALVPLVQGLRWFATVLFVVVAICAAGAAMRQLARWVVAVLAFQVVVLVLLLTVLFVRDQAILGVLPGPQTFSAFRQLLEQGLTVTTDQGAPVDGSRGLLLLVALGLGLVALAVDFVAASLRRPAAAGLPLLAVYCVPAAVLPDGLDWQWFLAAAVGYLVLLGADSADRIRGWGRVVGGRRSRQGATGELHRLTGGDRRVAAMSLLLALLVPVLVPGLGDRLLPGEGNGAGDGAGGRTVRTVNPILDLRKQLTARDRTPMITYKTNVSQPEPLRMVTADEFTGSLWRPRSYNLPRDQLAKDGLPNPPGLTAQVRTQAASTDISVLNLRQSYLPLPYPTIRVDIVGDWRFDGETLNVIGVDRDTRNLTYLAQHEVVTPTTAQLEAAGSPPPALSHYLDLPKNMPGTVRQKTIEVAGEGTPYDKAVKLQAWFRTGGGFVYSEVPSGAGDDSGLNAVVAFLRDKRGYCVQFASAMAVMARTLGIPARVAVGFLPGIKGADGRYSISLQDAHAWPELFFQGVGWVRFEPTPSQRSGAAPPWSLAADSPKETTRPSVQASTSAPAKPAARIPDDPRTSAPKGLLSRLSSVATTIPWQVVLGALLLLLLGLVPPVAAGARRRLRRRRAQGQVARAEAGWDELRERLGDLAVPWVSSRTPRVFASWLEHEYILDETAHEALRRLVADLEGARYLPPGREGGRSQAQISLDVRAVRDGVATQASGAVRRRARWLPASGFAALSGAPFATGARPADGRAESPVESMSGSQDR